MRKYILTMVLAIVSLTVSAANHQAKVYMFGFAASFNDSTVVFTDIQQIDSAYIDSKTKFLYGREYYSGQLRNYLSQQDFVNPTCVTVFATSRKEIEKKYSRLFKKYTNPKNKDKFIIKEIKSPDFVYEAVKFEQ